MRDKQIEEMAKVIGTVPPVEIYGGRSHGKKVFYTTHIAEHLYDNGYRKSTEVAEELLEMAECYGAGVLFWKKVKQFAIELKKK